MYYVVPDLHGHSLILKKLLEYLQKSHPNGGKIIFIGDYIDRGPDPSGVIDLVRNPPEGWEFVTLKGNHEDMFVSDYLANIQPWCPSMVYAYPEREDREEVARWMNDLPEKHREGNNIFVHAFYDETMRWDDQFKQCLIWERCAHDFEFKSDDIFVTHGHTPHTGLEMTRNRLNLDQGYHWNKLLSVAVFEEDKLGPKKIIDFYLDGESNLQTADIIELR